MDNERTEGLDGLFQTLREVEGTPPAPEVSEAAVPSEAEVAVAGGVDADKPPEEPEAPPAHQEAGQPRDEFGRFLPKEETQQPDAAQEPAELPADEGEWETVRVPLDDGQTIEAEVAPELAAHINELQSRVEKLAAVETEITTAREYAQEAAARHAELDEIETYIAEDPTGYLADRVRPELRQQVVLDLLLSDDSIYEAVAETLDKWLDSPHERRVQAAERRAQRIEKRSQFEQTKAQRAESQQRASVLLDTMRGYVPTNMEPDTARRFQQDMYRDLTEYGERYGWRDVTPENLSKILSFRLNQYNVNPNQLNGARRTNDGLVVAEPANDAAKAIADARAASERIQKQYQRRRAAGATAPAGAGTPVNRARPPKGASLQEALDWARQNIGGA
jgi:hypothetical protein